MNPPFSKARCWVKKVTNEALAGKKIVLLIKHSSTACQYANLLDQVAKKVKVQITVYVLLYEHDSAAICGA